MEHRDPHIVVGWRDPAELEPPLRPDGHRDFRRITGLLTQPHAALGPRGLDRPVWHCVVRAAPGDRMLSDTEWGHLARDIMDRTGLAPHGQDGEAVRWLAVRHADDHIHIVGTLARQDGTRPQFWNDYYRVREACRAAEERHGLWRTAPGDRTADRRPARAEHEKARRQGRPEAPRITLRRAVSTAAAGAGSEEEFFARLREAGVQVRARYSTRNPGQVTGYAVALTGDTARAGGPVWFSGGKLARDLSLPRLRARWDGTSPQAQPGIQLTAEERNAIWEHAARTAHEARDRIRLCAATDPAAASDAAWAASDTLHAAAAALGSRVIRQAADSYARAARMPYARIPRPTPAGNSLRQTARLLSRAALLGQNPAACHADLVTQLVALVEAVIELRQAQQRAAQAAAARRAAEHLHAERKRLTRRTESPAARSARVAAESFPVSPWAAARAPGAHQPAWAGPRASRGPSSSRPRGPTR
ncbi:MAG: relaxase/mobilization nuclease domain-containing protein [Streptosporangiales bacterium]